MKYGDIIANLDILNKQLVIQSKSLDKIHKVAEKKGEMFAHIPAIQPIANKEIRSSFSSYGMRSHPVLKVGKMHWGLD